MPKASFLAADSVSDDIETPAPAPRVAAAAFTTGTVELQPSQVVFDPVVAVRPLPDMFDQKVVDLAESLLRDGQAQAIVVRPPAPGTTKYRLVAGGGRLVACAMNRQTVRAEVRDVDDATAKRLAFEENYRRRDFSPVELGKLFIDARGPQFAADWSAAVSAQFHVSRATVTQHVNMIERLSSDPELLNAVDRREIAMDAALELAKAKDDERAELKRIAEAKAAEEAARTNARTPQAASERSRGGKTSPKAAASAQTAPAAKKPQVKAKHVRAAARELGGSGSTGARKPAEVLGDLCELVDRAYPAPMNAFLNFLCGSYVKGKGTEEQLKNHWRGIAQEIDGRQYPSKRSGGSKAKRKARTPLKARKARR